jgi:hypothetical protein
MEEEFIKTHKSSRQTQLLEKPVSRLYTVHIEFSQEDFLSQEQLVISRLSLKNTKEIQMLLLLIQMSQLLKSKKIMTL